MGSGVSSDSYANTKALIAEAGTARLKPCPDTKVFPQPLKSGPDRPATGDADHAHHPPGKSPLHAVGEEAIRVAAGALPGHEYGRFLDAGGEQLPPVRLRQIQ